MLHGYLATFNKRRLLFDKNIRANIVVDKKIESLDDIKRLEEQVSEKMLYKTACSGRLLSLISLIPICEKDMYSTRNQIQITLNKEQ